MLSAKMSTDFDTLRAHDRKSASSVILIRFLQATWLVVDLICFAMTFIFVMWMLELPISEMMYVPLSLCVLVRLAVFINIGMYRSVLRYSGIHTLTITCVGIGVGSVVAIGAEKIIGNINRVPSLGNVFYVFEALSAIALCGGTRLFGRMVLESCWRRDGTRAIIYGAGDLGELTLRTLRRLPGWHPIGFMDDDPKKSGLMIHGFPVLGTVSDLDRICKKYKPKAVFVAISNLDSAVARQFCRDGMLRDLRVTVVRGVESDGATLRMRDLKFEDLLPRLSRSLDAAPVKTMLSGRSVMVTGAGGTIGSELCRQIASMQPSLLVVLDHSEFNLYQIEQCLRDQFPDLALIPILDDLQHRETLDRYLGLHRPQVVFHAAAYKHVPLVEANPYRGAENNIGGFANLLQACDDAAVERLVLISTDKAVRPTNIMGATKRVCELLLQNTPVTTTRLCAVRFGNVLGSSGSVVPRFLEQISAGGPVTVTHPDITRYFMLVPEAVSLVLQAGAMASHGEIFILDMGEPVRIADLARQLIYMAGKRPGVDIEIKYSGLRPGEKLYEELLMDESERGTPIQSITVSRPTLVNWPTLRDDCQRLLDACTACDQGKFATALRAVVPEWTPNPDMAAALDRERNRASGRFKEVHH